MWHRSVASWAVIVGLSFAMGMLAGRYERPGTLPSGLESISGADATAQHQHVSYVCPMHPDVVSDRPGTCPVCGMALVAAKPDAGVAASETAMAGAMDDVSNAAAAHPIVRVAPEVISNLGVKTAAVIRTTLRRRIETPGFVQQIQPGQTRRITAPFAARVVSVAFTPGHLLEAGASLLVLESETLRAAERAHLVLLRQDTAQAQTTVDQPLPADATSPPLTLEDSRRTLMQLGLSLDTVHQLEETGTASAQLTLSAPYAAEASDLQVAVGDRVEAGALLFTLTGMARASVLANAFQRDATWIQTGQPVEIRLPHVSGAVWPGVVNQGAVSIDPNSQNIGVRLSFSAPTPLLKSAMYVVASILGDPRADVLAIPQTALIRTEHEDRVIVARDGGRFQPVTVHAGLETGGQVEILDGLQVGDKVVTSAQFLIDSESSLQASFLRMSGS